MVGCRSRPRRREVARGQDPDHIHDLEGVLDFMVPTFVTVSLPALFVDRSLSAWGQQFVSRTLAMCVYFAHVAVEESLGTQLACSLKTRMPEDFFGFELDVKTLPGFSS